MVMLAVVCSVTFTSCGDDDEPNENVNGINLTGTHWYNNDYGLTFNSATEAVLNYRSGGSDTYYVVTAAGIEAKYNGYDLMLLNGGKNGYAEWWIAVSESKITMSSPSGSRKMTLYKDNDK